MKVGEESLAGMQEEMTAGEESLPGLQEGMTAGEESAFCNCFSCFLYLALLFWNQT